MSARTKLRIFGGIILLFNLWAIGEYNIQGFPVLLMTVVFAVFYEFIVVRLLCGKD
jgi:hypothetical protein